MNGKLYVGKTVGGLDYLYGGRPDIRLLCESVAGGGEFVDILPSVYSLWLRVSMRFFRVNCVGLRTGATMGGFPP